jgi:hypothetical protein
MWLRRIRGALGMGLLWAFACSAVGTLPRWVFGVNADAPFPLLFGLFGFFSGITFSAILAVTEGRRTFEQMSVKRFAGWGALGGFLLSAAFTRLVGFGLGDVLVVVPSFALAGAICASGSLALARRATRRELPGSPDNWTELPGNDPR